ncbi:regucalcin-like [Haliotis rubra]|uniref:regucalcin-like n=1 Tax=Haliotis rubra TaxID=36100 RepID=UPI001EE5A200|nr:regucalcin-like [Haliotis rubra]
MSERIEVVVKNSTMHGEAPHWDDTTQCLYYVDMFVDDVHRYNAVTGKDSKINIGNSATLSTIIPRQKGGFVVSQKTDLAFLDSWDSGKVTSIAKVEADTNFLNDGKADASGRLWIGSAFNTIGIDPANWLKEQGSLYSLEVDMSVKKRLSKITSSNGMAWTGDNSVMYYIDTIPRQVWAFDFDLTAGSISNKRGVTNFSRFPEIPAQAIPDGMTIDTDGKLWVASYEGGEILQIDPHTGTVIRAVKFPCEKITSCCFGGKDFTDLYVTSSAVLMTPAEMAKTPLAGSVFKVTGLGVRGSKANVYSG